GAEMASDALSPADEEAFPPATAAEPLPPGLRAALAGRERLLAAQATVGLGVAGQIRGLSGTRRLPARLDSQPDAPRRYGVEDFNRALDELKDLRDGLPGKILVEGLPRRLRQVRGLDLVHDLGDVTPGRDRRDDAEAAVRQDEDIEGLLLVRPEPLRAGPG